MSFDFNKNIIRIISIVFCAIFLLQISADLYNKLESKKGKQSSPLVENLESEIENESLNDDCESENEQELESEIDKIIVHQSLNFTKNRNCFLQLSQSRLIQINLSAGFYKTIIPPPKQS